MRGRRSKNGGSLSKRGRIWYIRYTFEGKERCESSRSTNREDARVLLATRLRQRGAISANAATLATDGLLSTIGAAAELVIAADLLNRGIEVFRSLTPHCSCDLVARSRDDKLHRIEVKTGTIGKGGRPLLTLKRQTGRFDVLAVVSRTQGIFYFPAIETWALDKKTDDLQTMDLDDTEIQ